MHTFARGTHDRTLLSSSGLSSVIVGGTPNTLQASEVTLGELFKSVNYATGMTGKWHLGASEQSWPTRQGFDEYRKRFSNPPMELCIAMACNARACRKLRLPQPEP